MPHFTIANLFDDVTLWEPTGVDRYGAKTRGSAIEHKARVEKRKTFMIDNEGNKIALDATMKIDREVPMGTAVFIGTLADWLGTGTGSGGESSELYEVVSFAQAADIKGRHRSRQCGLRFYRDTLPDAT